MWLRTIVHKQWIKINVCRIVESTGRFGIDTYSQIFFNFSLGTANNKPPQNYLTDLFLYWLCLTVLNNTEQMQWCRCQRLQPQRTQTQQRGTPPPPKERETLVTCNATEKTHSSNLTRKEYVKLPKYVCMSMPTVTMEMANTFIGTLSLLAPRPTGANIYVLEQD